MSRYRILILVPATLSATLWAYACGDGTTAPPTPRPPRPTTVAVTPATTQLTALGATVQLSAEVRDQNGQVMAGAAVTWSSSTTSIATVSGSGLVTAAGNGTVTIAASAGGASGTAAVTVTTSDRAALVALYQATDGQNWVSNENWLTDAPLGEWYGVRVDGQGQVAGLSLGSSNLSRSDPVGTRDARQSDDA